MIRLSAQLYQDLKVEATRAYPKECCGLLVGESGPDGINVTEIVASPNLAENGGEDRFLIDPQVQFDLMRRLGDGPQQIIGSYHSHPNHPAEPSETDRREAYYPEHVMVIVAATQDTAGPVQAWRLNTDQSDFLPVPLQILR